MTAISYVTPTEMKKETGLENALGYAFPEEDKILIRKGLSKKKKKEVLAHEVEHIEKGEEGPWIGAAIAAGSAIIQGIQGSKASKKAGKGASKQIEFAREAMNLARADTRHSRQAGATALNALMSMTGLSGSGNTMQYDENGWPTQSAGVGGALDYQGDAPVQGPEQIPNNFADNAVGPPVGDYRSAYDVQSRAYGGPTGYANGGSMYNINEMGPENVYSGGALSRNPNPMTIAGQEGYVQPNIQGRFSGGEIFAATGDPLLGAAFGSSKPKRGVLPNTDWQRNDQGRLMDRNELPQGHWNNDLGKYVNRRGKVKRNQAAAPEGWEANPTDIDTTQGLDYQWQTDPGYQFRFEEGQRALDRGAAARGGLLSGGYGRKAVRYGQGFASNEFTNVYNRIMGIAGQGQVANQHAGNAAQYGGTQMGQGALNYGAAGAYGDQLVGNAVGAVGNAAGTVDWGNIWSGNQQQPSTRQPWEPN